MSCVTSENIIEYQDSGVTILRGFWDDLEVDAIENAVSDVAMNPSPMVDIFEKDDEGNTLFFNDFNNWRRIPSIKAISFKKKNWRRFLQVNWVQW